LPKRRTLDKCLLLCKIAKSRVALNRNSWVTEYYFR
jgi:hypothetical protein